MKKLLKKKYIKHKKVIDIIISIIILVSIFWIDSYDPVLEKKNDCLRLKNDIKKYREIKPTQLEIRKCFDYDIKLVSSSLYTH